MPSVARAAGLLTPINSGVAGGSRTSTVTGTAVDCDGMAGSVIFTQQVDTVGGTSPTLDGKIQECETSGGTYTDVAGATATQVTASNVIQNIVVDRSATKRFLRYVGTIAGTSPSFAMSVICNAFKAYR